MRKARELTIVLLLALGALLIGGILLEQLHRDHLYLDLHATSLKTVLFAILAVVFLATAVFCALYLIYNRKTKSVSVLPGIVGYFSCLILCSAFLTASLSAVLCSYTTDVADLSGEPSQKLAAVGRAFPPHPLRTRFSQRIVKIVRASASEPPFCARLPYDDTPLR